MEPTAQQKYPDWATAYTDASFDSNTGEGSWGVYLRHSKAPFKVERGGRCDVRDSFAAEMHALVVAVALAQVAWPDLKGIGVKTDCKSLLHVARWDSKPHRRPDIARLQSQLQTLLDQGPYLRVRWVKAHQTNRTVQGWVNNRVDRIAKRHRKK